MPETLLNFYENIDIFDISDNYSMHDNPLIAIAIVVNMQGTEVSQHLWYVE